MTPICWTPALKKHAFPHPSLGVPYTPTPLPDLLEDAKRSTSAGWPTWMSPLPPARMERRASLLQRLRADVLTAGEPLEDLWLTFSAGLNAADLWWHLGGTGHMVACLIEAGALLDEIDLGHMGADYLAQLAAARALLSSANPADRSALLERFRWTLAAPGARVASVLPFLVPEATGLAEELLARPGVRVHQIPHVLLSVTDAEALREGLNDASCWPLLEMSPEGEARPGRAWECLLLGLVASAGHAATPALLGRVGSSGAFQGMPSALVQALTLLGSDEALAGVVSLLPRARRPASATLTAAGARGVRALAAAPSSPDTRALLETMLAGDPGLQDAALAAGGWTADLVARSRSHSKTTAPVDTLPPVLRSPPWLRGGPAKRPLVPGLQAPTWEESVQWKAGEQEAWIASAVDWRRRGSLPPYVQKWLREALGLPGDAFGPGELERPDLVDELRPLAAKASEPIRPSMLMLLPPEAACMVWSTAPLPCLGALHFVDDVRSFVAEHGLGALDGLLRWSALHPARAVAMLRPFDTPRAAPLIAHALAELRLARTAARDWLRSHPDAAAAGLVPIALDTPPGPGEQAVAALRLLAAWGRRASILQAAERHGEAAREAIVALLDTDPLLLFPAATPPLPAFVRPDALPPPELTSGGVLSVEAVGLVLSMLRWSSPDMPYAGVAQVRAACTTASLDAFVWALYETWLGHGAPAKEAWAFRALGLLGGDAIAARLDPLIRKWPLESQHPRAVMGLDVLVRIGTDAALQHLDAIATKTKTKVLQAEARERIEQIASDRGLTRDDLSDRITPDLGLAPDGTLVLDFGPRRFTARLDHALKPVVLDATGAQLKDLPKPGAKDDPERAAAAVEAWKELKRAARDVGAHVIRRMERAMVTGATWSVEDLRRLFVPHPVLGGIARRLVWVVDGRPVRLDEEGGFVDADDRPVTASGVVHLAHPADTDGLDTLGRSLAEYSIAQPFLQVGRPVKRLSDEEASGCTLRSFAGLTVATTRLLGLLRLGWTRGRPQDAGTVFELLYDAGDDLSVTVSMEPGIFTDRPTENEAQTLQEVRITRPGGQATFGALGLRRASELLGMLGTLSGAT